ncbi:hypothetical protein ACIHAA_31630 [Streptomyces sp. NPDC052040]|uniref:hypothetical protein n=1 Tax=unclassified Streptomyces TaxID=2593676 RepID=UPI0037D0C042
MRSTRHPRACLLLLAALAAGPAPLAAVAVAASPAAAADCAPDDTQCDENQKDQKETAKERQEVNDSVKDAKQDIAKAQTQVDECRPESAACMKRLAGDGAQEKEGIARTEQALADFRGAPTDNAGSAVANSCGLYAASLPVSGPDAEELTRMCEETSR